MFFLNDYLGSVKAEKRKTCVLQEAEETHCRFCSQSSHPHPHPSDTIQITPTFVCITFSASLHKGYLTSATFSFVLFSFQIPSICYHKKQGFNCMQYKTWNNKRRNSAKFYGFSQLLRLYSVCDR